MRPKKHSIHPSDLHILVNTVQSSSSVNSSAAASWLPICLPKFNPAAFVNAYVTFLRRKDADTTITAQTTTSPQPQPVTDISSASEPGVTPTEISTAPISPPESEAKEVHTRPATPDILSRSEATSSLVPRFSAPSVEVGLICVSGLGDFDAVRSWCTVTAEVRNQYIH